MSVLQPLRISYVELQSLKNVEFIELVVPGCRRRIRQQGKNLFREEFAQPLMIQGEVLSFSVHQKKSYSSSIPAVNDIQIDINVRDVLSNSQAQKFHTVRTMLDIIIGLSPNSISVDAVPAEDDYTPPNTGSPLATTKELLNQCSRFRILVAGQTGVGKSTLLNRVFGVSQASVEDFKPEKAGQQERTARAASKAPMSAHNYKHVHHRPLPPPSNASVTNKSRSNAASDSNKNFQNDNKIWSTRSTEERERIKEFWLGLGEDERRNLVKIEKDTILKKMKYQQKHNCSCAVCGRKRHAIEEELVVLYDAYYEELERYANHQQRYLSSGGTIPPPPGPGPFPGSVELDRNGVVIGYPQTKLSCYPPPTNRTALLTDGWKSPKAESDFEEDEDEFEDEDGYDEEEQSVDTCGRRPVNGTKLNDGDGMFNVGSSITVTGPSNILTVADDLLKNDAHKFLEMMDQLAAHRMQRKEETGADVVDGSEEDDEHEDEDEDEDSKEVMTEGQRVEEAKRMFSIFAARMFEARVLESYLERVALERQQQLLRELEFEDQLTKERQTKKKLQNQKKKDKRRQQRQTEEQGRAPRAAEGAAEEAVLGAKQLEPVPPLVNRADSLHEKPRKEGDMGNLTETITRLRDALQHTPGEHPDYPLLLAELADYLDKRFNEERGIEDLTEIITLRHAALQLTPPGHQGRFVSLVNLLKSLHERFIISGTLADLDEIIAFRRAALECTPPTPSDRCMSLLNLADCLRERYQRLGVDAELAEAIKHALAALVLSPLEHDASCRHCVASCVELKARKWRLSASTVLASGSGAGSWGVKEMVRNIATETTKFLPLRLLNTYTGALCDRDAQISCFEDSVQYNELLSSTHGSPDYEPFIRKEVSRFFGYTTLSHRWGTGELSLRNIQGNSIYDLDGGEGYAKLQSFCALTLRRGYRWAWSDTCCIDKESSSELQEAIGSMFSWYHHSALTIVYLFDISSTRSFTNSIWFRRGWTLQELLASPRIQFYTQDWSLYMNCTSLNHKVDGAILTELEQVTQIGKLQLKSFTPGVHDARSKLQWASTRRTTRPEDIAYSLFGIFQVPLPVIYGETAQVAIGRLLAEIVLRSGDVSVLDWVGEASSFHSCFPATLGPFQVVPLTESMASYSSNLLDVNVEKVREWHRGLARLPPPRFFAGRLVLPCLVHRIISVKLLETSPTTSYHDYEVIASDLVPLKLTLASRLQEGSDTGWPYVLVRPCNPKLLHQLAHGDDLRSLLEWLGQPFNALLLKSLLHNEYKRIASYCLINARVHDLAGVVNSECQTLEVV